MMDITKTASDAVPLNSAIADALAIINLAGARSPDEIEAALEPLARAIVQAMAGAERVDISDILGRLEIPAGHADCVDGILDRALEEGRQRMPIMRTFALARPVRVLQGLAELSFVAGRAGDNEWDWSEELDEALIDAFYFQRVSRVDWLEKARAALRRAFDAGVAQSEIDQVDGIADRSMNVARAHAYIYWDECEFPGDSCPSAIDSAIGAVAYKLAEYHPLSPAEAAYAAITAFNAEGMRPSIEVADYALDRARFGHAERVAVEDCARRRAALAHEAAVSIFGADA